MLPSVDTVASILLLLILVSGSMGVAVPAMRSAWREPSRWAWLITPILVAAAWLRFVWVPPHHAMYVDEPWYLEAARNLLRRGAPLLCQRAGDDTVCTPYPKATGWPVMLAAAFAVFGESSRVAFAVSVLLSTAAVLLAAAVARLAGGSRHHAAFAALLVAIHPLHVAWSATAETNGPATAILLAGIAGVLLLRRAPSWANAALAAGGLGLAAAMRPEMAMALPPALLVLTLARARPRDVMVVALGGALGATSVIASWPLYLANSGGTFLSASNVGANFSRLLASEEGGPLTLFILGLSAAGIIVSLRRRTAAIATLLGGGAFLIALVAIGYDQRIFYTRTVLGALVLLAPLAALALPDVRRLRASSEGSASALPGFSRQSLPRLSQVMVAAGAWMLAMVLAVPGLQRVARVSDTQMLETRLPAAIARAAVPADAVVIAEWPTVLAAETNVIAAPARDFVAGDGDTGALSRAIETRPHFLLCDMFCEADFARGAISACARILRAFAVEEVAAVSDEHRRYGLYRLTRRARPGEDKAPCPFPSEN